MVLASSLHGEENRMLMLIDCVNCGKQVEVDSKDDICYWCQKPAQIKVNEKQIKECIKEVIKVVKKGGKMWAKHVEIETQKAEIIADFVALGANEMLRKWQISASGWNTIKKRWSKDIEAAVRDAPRRKSYKDEGFPLPQELKSGSLTGKVNKGKPELSEAIDWQQEYEELQQHFEGYRQAVLDIFGQSSVDIRQSKG